MLLLDVVRGDGDVCENKVLLSFAIELQLDFPRTWKERAAQGGGRGTVPTGV